MIRPMKRWGRSVLLLGFIIGSGLFYPMVTYPQPSGEQQQVVPQKVANLDDDVADKPLVVGTLNRFLADAGCSFSLRGAPEEGVYPVLITEVGDEGAVWMNLRGKEVKIPPGQEGNNLNGAFILYALADITVRLDYGPAQQNAGGAYYPKAKLTLTSSRSGTKLILLVKGSCGC